MKLKTCISVAVLLVTVVNAFGDHNKKCPDYQLKCPTCGPDEECVYPNSGGCPGAGIPVCKSTQCQTVRCKGPGKTCPKECPFSCNYDESACCPFTGEPVCEPVCNTFVPCKVTPCPENCPGQCHYPDAASCCPRSGEAVCNIEKRSVGLGYKSGGNPNEEWGISYSLAAKAWEEYPYTYDDSDYIYQYGQDYEQDRHHEHGRQHEHVHDANCGHGHGHRHDLEDYGRGHDHEHHGHHEDHNHGDDDYFEGLFIGGLNTDHECHSCVKTVTDIDISLEFVTTTTQPEEIFCAQYIVPCPDECADSCVYPMDHPCPFTLQPWCPNDPAQGRDCHSVYPTDGYPFPYFPTYDPYYSTFTALMNSSGATTTPSFVTDVPVETPVQACPMIFRYCPIECPDSCLRPDVPCPFAAEGYCPGDIPTTTVSDNALITPTAETVVGGELVCPLYLLACPVCPEGYSCSRDTTGHCANTNVPFCVSALPPTPTPTPIFEFYPGQLSPPLNRLVQSPNMLYAETPDPCAEAGFAKVASKEVFDQLQKPRQDCNNCTYLDWDEACQNTCIFSTEDDCCVQTLCLP